MSAIKASIEFTELSVPHIHEKLSMFAQLLGVEPRDCALEIQGDLIDEEGTYAFLHDRLRRVDTSVGFRRRMLVYVDGEWMRLRPEGDELVPFVRLSYPRPASLE